MTFTAVSAGELIKASIANANWRHVGRLGDNLLPMNTSGVATDDTYDLGSATYQWKDLYLSATGKIYIGGVELSLGGGGGGGGLESLALANAFEKNGMSYPLPNNKNIRNAFVDDTEILLYLRKNYSTADTTTMVADHGTASELETINDFETVGDFTSGTSTPTVAANTTDKLENTQSIKFTATTLNGSADMYDAVTLSLTDRNFRVSVYPDTLTNVSFVYVILYTSSGNQRKFDFAVANLTAKAWNHLTCDLNLASGTTSGGVTVTDTGTFNRSNITRIYYGITTTSAQTVVPSFDLARAISDKPLMIPDYGLTLTIQDNTNQDSFTITAEDLTDYTTQGTYTIDATLGNAYTNIDSTNYASSTTGTIQGGQFIHKSTASGQNAKTAKQHDVLALSTTLATGTLESFLRFYDESFEVTEFPTTGSIKVYADSDKSGYFLDNDYILLFKKLQHGRNSQSPEGSHTVNFLRLQLNANASYSSNEITLSHDGSNSVGADTTGYYVILESAYLEYSAGSKTATNFTQAVPSELIVNQSTDIVILEDDFNRSNENPITSRGWQGFTSDGLSSNRWQISSNELYSFSATTRQVVWQEGIVTDDFSVRFKFKTRYNGGSGGQRTFFRIGSNETPSDNPLLANSASGKGLAIRFGYDGVAAGSGGTIYYDGELKAAYSGGFTDNTYFYLKIEKRGKQIKVKRWLTSVVEPDAFDFSFGVNSSGLSGRSLLFYNSSDGSQYAFHVDDFILEGAETGYTLKYKITDLTNVDKLETVHTLMRNDTTNQNPILYETASLLY